MTPESLFEQIKSINNPPAEAVFTAIDKQQKKIIPLLMNEVIAFSDNPNSVKNQGEDYIRHVISLYLLAYFRHKKAYPHIVNLVSHPDNKVISLTGEVLTEALGRILASVYNGDLTPIKSIVENSKTNTWVRSAALESLVVLWKEDAIERITVIDYLTELMQGKLERAPSYVWDNVGLIAFDVHPNGMEKLLREAIDDRLIAPLVLDSRTLDDCIKTDLNPLGFYSPPLGA